MTETYTQYNIPPAALPIASPPTYLLLIDSSVTDYQDIINAKQPGVHHIVFDVPIRPTPSKKLFKNIEDKIAELGVSAFTGIGLVQHNKEKSLYEMFGRTSDRVKPIIQSVEVADPSLQSWNSISIFITMLHLRYGIQYFDMMACALYSNPDWKYVIDELAKKTGVTVRASTDDTGAAALGGDWFLESHTGVNLKEYYFTEAIENYTGVLVTAPASTHSTASGSTKRLILIDHRVKDIDVIINSMNDDTYCLVFNYFYDTPATILSKLRFLSGSNRYILDNFYYEPPALPTRMDSSGNHCTPCEDFDMDEFQLLPAVLQSEYLSYTMDNTARGGLWPFYSPSSRVTILNPVFFQRAKIGETHETIPYGSTDLSVVPLNYKNRPFVLVSDLDAIYELAQNAGEIVGDSAVFDCVGIIQHMVQPSIGYKFVEKYGGSAGGDEPAIIQDIQSRDANLASWAPFAAFIQSLKTVYQMTTLDLMACALYANPDWKYVIDTLAVQQTITIRASLDNTGTSADDGNWVLETNNVSLTDVYFTDKIYDWRYVLATYIDNRFYALQYNNSMYATRGYDSRFKIVAGTANFTIETWYYETSAKNNATIVDMGDYNYTFQVRNLNVGGPVGMSFYNVSYGDWMYAESAVVPVAQWSHIAITRSGSTFTFYINGVAKQTFSSSASFYSNNSTFGIGLQSPDSCVCNLLKDGNVLYDLRLWNVARSASEILMYRNRVIPSNTPGLVANYLCNDNTGTITDRTNGLNLTIQNYNSARWSNSTVPIPNVGFLINNNYSLTTNTSGGSLNALTHFDNITYTDFSGVNLTGVNFSNADLTGCNFTNANLTNANLTNAKILDATLTGAITTGSSISSAITTPTQVLQFDGVDDAVIVGIPAWTYSTQFRTTMTVEFWFKTTDTNNQKLYSVLVSRNNSGGNSSTSQFSIQMQPTGEVGFGVTNTSNSGSYHFTTATYKDAVWHHAAFTYNSASGAKIIYIDGVLSRTDTVPAGFGLMSNNTTMRLIFGSDDAGITSQTDRQFRGYLSDVRIWNVVRSASEIAANYRQRLIGTETGLVGYWKLNQGYSTGWGSYSTALDSASNRSHGTLTNMGATPSGSWVSSNIYFQPRISTLTLGANNGVFNLTDSSFSFIDPSSNSQGNFTYAISSGTVATISNGAATTKTIYATSGAISIPTLSLYEFPEIASLSSWQIDLSFTVTGGSGTYRSLIGDMYNEINSFRGWGMWVSGLTPSKIHWSWNSAIIEPSTTIVNLNTPYVLTAAQSGGVITLTLRNMSGTYNSSLSISNLVASYNFDSNANDSSVNGNTLTNVGAVTYNTTDYKRGTAAASFNGSNYFEISNNGRFSPDNFSVAFWIKPVDSAGNYQAIASCRHSPSPNLAGWFIYINGNNNLEFWTGSGSNWFGPDVSLFSGFGTVNTWVHVAFTFTKSTSSLVVYINGNLITTASRTYTNNTINNLRIGAGANEGAAGFFLRNGTLMDDFRFYNKVLSASEINSLVSESSYSSSFSVGSNVTGKGPVTIGGFRLNSGENFPGTISYVNVSVPTNQRLVTLASSTGGYIPATVTATQAGFMDFAAGTKTASLTVSSFTPTFSTSFANVTKNYLADTSFALESPVSNSTGAFSFSSSNTAVATINPATTINALQLNGTTNFIDFGSNVTELGKASFTIECWVKTTGTSMGLLNCQDADTTWELGEKSMYIDSAGFPTFVGFGNNWIYSNRAVNDNVWHHIAVSWAYSGSGTSGTSNMYIDGKERSSQYLSFSGNNTSYLRVPYNAALIIGTADFTIEWYQYQTDNNGSPRVFEFNNNRTPSVTLEGGRFYYWSAYSTNNSAAITWKNTWVHFAIVRISGIITIYRNGVAILTFSDTTNYTTSSDLIIGNQSNVSEFANLTSFGGNLQYFHFLKGIGKYTGTFTPVITNQTATANTVLLIDNNVFSGTLGSTVINNNVSLSNLATYVANNNNFGTFVFGKPNNSESANYFNGAVCELRVWNIARSATDIFQNYRRMLVGNESGLVAYNRFNQGTAGGTNTGVTTVTNNKTSGGFTGTLSGSFALTGTASNWVSGVSIRPTNDVNVVGAGTTTITATQQAEAEYASLSTTATLTVNKLASTLGALTVPSNKTVGDGPFSLTAPTSTISSIISPISTITSPASVVVTPPDINALVYGNSWTQRGGDIDGEVAGDNSGYSVTISADGNVIAIGGRFNDGSGNEMPNAIYLRTGGSNWRDYIPLLTANSSTNIQAWSPDAQFYDIGNGGGNEIAKQFAYFAGYWLNRTRASSGQSYSIPAFASAGSLGTFTFTATSNYPVTSYTGNLTGYNSTTYTLTAQTDGNTAGQNVAFTGDIGHVRVYRYNSAKAAAQLNQGLSGFGPVGWDRLGGDIDGETAADQSGISVSLSADGTVIAIGANGNDAAGDSAGHVRVYKYTPSKTVAVTSQSDASFGPIGWNRLGADIDGEVASDQSGGNAWDSNSVKLSADGTTVAIAALYNDGANGVDSGHVRVYKYTPSKTLAVTNQSDASFGPIGWNRLGADIDGEAAYDYSGYAIGLSADGTIVAIGAYGNDAAGDSAGQVRVYKYTPTKTVAVTNQNDASFGPIGWNRMGADIDGGASSERSGTGIGISADGTIVAIGAHFNNNNTGQTRVYKYTPTKSVAVTNQTDSSFGPIGWNRLGADINGETVGEFSGACVSLSADGTVVAIGATRNDGASGADSGNVRIYKYIPSKTVAVTSQSDASFGPIGWTRLGADIDGKAANDWGGQSVALSSDGTTVVIGALYNDGTSGNTSDNRGHARVYNISTINALTYTSSNSSVADVCGNLLLIKGVNGTSTITATQSGNTINGKLDVSGTTYTLQYNPITYTSSNTAIATVSTYGTVTITGGGATTITATQPETLSYASRSVTASLVVSSGITPTFGTFTVPSKNIADTSFNLTAPTSDSSGAFVYTSSQSAVATVTSNGVVTIVGVGSTTITATQDACGNYISRAVTATLTVNKLASTLGALTVPTNKTVADVPFNLTAPTSSISSIISQISTITSPASVVVTPPDINALVYGNSWTQRGGDIDGEVVGEEGGGEISLSADGNVVAITAVFNDANGNDSGCVRIYAWNGSTWIKRGVNINGEAADDYSGRCVSLSADGSIVAIGAYLNNGNGTDAGQVRVYVWNGTTWIQRGTDIDGETTGDQSGTSVKLSADGSVVAIGGPYNDGNGNNSGHVRVYAWNGSTWVKRDVDIDGEAINDLSGYSVGLSADGSVVAIGANYNDGNGTDSGHVRVYVWNGSIWTKRGVDIDGEGVNDLSGWCISLSADGSIIAIGAPNNDGNGTDSGHVRVYAWNGTVWVKRGLDIDGEAVNDFSGRSVSLSADGSVVAIGAPFNDGNGNESGQIRIYVWNGSTWVQRGMDIDGEVANDRSGWSVSISADGSIVAIGAPRNSSAGYFSGHARIYKITITNALTYTSSNSSVADIYGNLLLIKGVNGTSTITATQSGNTINGKLDVSGTTYTLQYNPFTYTSSNTAIATVSTYGTVTITGGGTTTITATQPETLSYASRSATASLVVSLAIAPTFGTFTVPGKLFRDASFSLTAPTTDSSGAFTYTIDAPSVATVTSGGVVTVVGAGSATITVTQAASGNFTSRSVTGVLVVSPIAPTFGTFTVPGKLFRDTSFSLSAPTTDSSGAFTYSSNAPSVATVTSGGVVTVVGAGSATITAIQDACGNYTTRSATASLVVSPIAPTFGTFTVPAKLFRDGSFSLTAPTTDSSGAFTYSSNAPSVATVTSGGVVTVVGAGSATITAIQDACGNFTTRSVTGVLVVSPIAPTFGTFTVPAKLFRDGSFSLTAPTTDSSGAFTYSIDASGAGVATVTSGGVVTVVGVGSATITATQAASGNFTSRSVTGVLVVSPIAPTFGTFTVPGKLFRDTAFSLTAPTTDSSGAFTYTIDASDAGVATVTSGGVVTVVETGSATITVTQDACGNFTARTMTGVLVVSPIAPVISPSTITKNYGDASFNIQPSSTNTDVNGYNGDGLGGGLFSFSGSSNTSVITVFDTSYVGITGVESAFITVSQTATKNFTSGSQIVMVTINKGTPVLSTFSVISTRTYGSPPFSALSLPTSASNGVITYSSSDTNVATIDNSGVITLVASGYVTFIATQASTSLYNQATRASNTMTIYRRALPLTRLDPSNAVINKTYGDSYFIVSATNQSNGGAFTYETDNPNVAGIINASTGVISVVSVGTTTITARREQTAQYTSEPVSWTIDVARANTTLTGLTDLSYNVTTTPFTVTASSPSNGAVTYSLQDPSSGVLTIHPTTGLVTLMSPGTAVIVASQAQGTLYLAPASITATIRVSSAGNALQGATLTSTSSFASVDLSGASLTGVSITNTAFSDAKLSNANLTNAVITSANFTSANLAGATLAGATITGATFTSASLKNADLSGATLTNSVFTGSDLSGARLRGVDASGASFANAKLNNVNMTGANVQNVNFTNTSIKGANITGVSFSPLQKLQLLKNSDNRDIGQIIIPAVSGTTILSAISETSPLRAIANLDLTSASVSVSVVVPTTSTSPTAVLPDVILNVTDNDKFYLPINESEYFQIEGVKYFTSGGVVRNYATNAVVDVITYNGKSIWLLAGSIVGLVLQTNPLNTAPFVVPNNIIFTDATSFMPTTLPTSNSESPIVYSSSNTYVATIDPSSGLITPTGNTGAVKFIATQVQNSTYEPGSKSSNYMNVNKHINFSLTGLNQSFSLSTLAMLDASAVNIDATDATSVFYVRLSDINNIFRYQSDAFDVNDIISSDVKYYVFHRKWPIELKINPSHAMMNKSECFNMLGVGAGYTSEKSLLKHDFIRHIALRLFNTIHAVDLFTNETDLQENSVYLGETVRHNIDVILSGISTTSNNETMLYDASGNKYLLNDSSGNTNLCRELMRQIAASAPSRFYNNDGNHAGLKSVPFLENDSISFKVIIQSAVSQNALTGVNEIPSRSYTIKLVMKNTVTTGINENTVTVDSEMYPNAYPYSSSVMTYAPTSASSAVYNSYSPPAPIPFARFGFNGWYFTNSVAWVTVAPTVRNHIKWIVSSNTGSSTVGDLQYIRLNLKIHNNASLPYLMVYTQSLSARKYAVSGGNGSLVNGTKYSMYMNFNTYSREPATVGYTNASLAYTIGSGAFTNNEVITSIALESDGNAAAGNVEFTLASIVVGERSRTSGVRTEKEYGFEAAVPESYP